MLQQILCTFDIQIHLRFPLKETRRNLSTQPIFSFLYLTRSVLDQHPLCLLTLLTSLPSQDLPTDSQLFNGLSLPSMCRSL